MFKIRTMNAISENGVAYLEKRGCEVGPAVETPDAMLIRSADLHGMQFNPELLAIGRAGAGYNNIPVEQLAEEGIVVFNSPGANAEAVKEQEMMSLIMASRDVLGAIDYVRSIAEEYSFPADNIGLIGFSAGAYQAVTATSRKGSSPRQRAARLATFSFRFVKKNR